MASSAQKSIPGCGGRWEPKRTVSGNGSIDVHAVGVDDGNIFGFGAVRLNDMLLGLVDKHPIWRGRLGNVVFLLKRQVSKSPRWRVVTVGSAGHG